MVLMCFLTWGWGDLSESHRILGRITGGDEIEKPSKSKRKSSKIKSDTSSHTGLRLCVSPQRYAETELPQ